MTTTRERFLAEYTSLDVSGTGFIMLRTKEPHRVEFVVREWAYGHRRPYRRWSPITGLLQYNIMDPSELPRQVAQTNDLPLVLRGIGSFAGQFTAAGPSAPAQSGSTAPQGANDPYADNAIFSIMWPHFFIPKNPIILSMLVEMASVCAETKRRVCMIVHPSFEVPSEIENVTTIIDFDTPDREELSEIYTKVMVQSVPVESKRIVFNPAQTAKVLNGLTGMTEVEAEEALARAIAHYRDKLPHVTLEEFLPILLQIKTETVKRSEVLEVVRSEVMSNVGGLDELKTWVAHRAFAFGDDAREAGVDRPKGIMLVGPPGTGKSLAAKAIANELGQPLIKFDLSRVYGSLVGSSEAKIRAALKMLVAMAPCTVLVDEIDKMTSSTNSSANDGGISTRILGTLLNFMQESTAEVFWVLTANRVQNLPSELVRKGRLDEVFAILMPAVTERKAILDIQLRKRKVDPATVEGLQETAENCNGFVGSELEQAVADAKLHCFVNKVPMTGALITQQLGKTKPLSEAFRDDFDAMSTWAANNARPASSVAPVVRQRVRGGSTGTRQMGLDNPASDVSPTKRFDLD